jgi:pyruvate formate lyase activating enzyme
MIDIDQSSIRKFTKVFSIQYAMENAQIFNIQRYSVQDGPGIRTTVFFKGCPLGCQWCHNPESHVREPEIWVNENLCRRCGECREYCPQQGPLADGTRSIRDGVLCIRCGQCVAACPIKARQLLGHTITVAEMFEEIVKDRIFYDESGGGVTFSGGEPLLQADILLEILKLCRVRGIHTAVDTCGYAPRQDLLALGALTDLMLYDLKIMDDRNHREYTGVSNRLILDNLVALGKIHHNIWIRIPIVPGVNDSPENLIATAQLLAANVQVELVNLLPFHDTGMHKLPRLDRPNMLGEVPRPTPELMSQAAGHFTRLGLKVKIGG